MERRITIEAIAKACNTSIGTVDRALNNRDGINEATKKKILEKAKSLGYHTNRLENSIGRTVESRIAFLDYNASSPAHGQLKDGVLEAADEMSIFGYKVEYYDIHRSKDEEDILNLINSNVFDGVIFNILGEDNSNIIGRIRPDLKTLFGSSIEFSKLHVDIKFGSDGDLCGCIAAGLAGNMCEEGKSIAVISSFLNKYVFITRFGGFCRSIKSEYPKHKLVPMVCNYTSIDGAEKDVATVLEDKNINVIHVTDINGTIGAMRAIKKSGRKDVKLIGYDVCEELADGLRNGYCTALLYHNTKEYASKSVRIMSRLIHDKGDITVSDYLFEPQIVMKYNVDCFLKQNNAKGA